jgi:NAD(P)-dependent dehydrogenase (short-subunit alcohol dehydrogenase family)
VAITGASKGIGRATALSFAKAGAGGIVLLARSRSDLSRLEDELVREAEPPQVLSLAVDVTDRAAVERAAATVKSRFGKVDVLINNAGYLEDWAPIADSDPEDWWKTWEVNVKGVYLVTKFFVPLLLQGALKTVVAVSSIGALVTTPGISAYQTTKAAVLRLNDCLMAEYGDKGLIAFGIHPGVSIKIQAGGAPPYQRGRKWLLFPGSQSFCAGRSDRVGIECSKGDSRYVER